VVERGAVLRERERPAGQRPREHVGHRHVAKDAAALHAVEALAAGGEPGEDDVVTLLDGRDPGADGLHDARALVAEHHRERVRGRAGDHVPVAVTDPARGDPHRHLAWARLGKLDVLDRQPRVDLPEDSCAHSGRLYDR
jgi:hypothetical protein